MSVHLLIETALKVLAALFLVLLIAVLVVATKEHRINWAKIGAALWKHRPQRKPGWPLAKRLAKAIISTGSVPDEVRPFIVPSKDCDNCQGDRHLPRWKVADAHAYLRRGRLAKALIGQELCTSCLNALAKLVVKPSSKAIVAQAEPKADGGDKKSKGSNTSPARLLFATGIAGMLAVYGLNELTVGPASSRANVGELIGLILIGGILLGVLLIVVLARQALKSVLNKK